MKNKWIKRILILLFIILIVELVIVAGFKFKEKYTEDLFNKVREQAKTVDNVHVDGKFYVDDELKGIVNQTIFNGCKYILQEDLDRAAKAETYVDINNNSFYSCIYPEMFIVDGTCENTELIHFTFPENINEYKVKFYKKEYIDDVNCIKCSLEDSDDIIYYYINSENYNVEKSIKIFNNSKFEEIFDYGNVKEIEKFDKEKYKEYENSGN